ncbi:hypothetical protein Y032_0010g952 [Ancylostoma ceylanicum]|uniref:Uncharacterized protein n=1 Tax=Ancylostoma ceylanicum TaxID=53326 RepID=A0A016VGL2_9BILA|nr:hypothetical protein Y032_0010g952 [Ancylostoma ceylanicum]
MLPSCTQAQILLLLLAITVSVANCEQEKTIPNSRLNHRLGRWFSWNVPYELIEKEWAHTHSTPLQCSDEVKCVAYSTLSLVA